LRYRHPLAGGDGLTSGRNRLASACGGACRQGAAQAVAEAGPAQRDVRLGRVEAVLLVANEPLSLRRISQFASLADATEARTLVRRLNQLYDSGGAAFRVEEVAGGFQLLSRRKFGGWLRRLHQRTVETRLSAPAMETLAVVAYRQPVLRAEIEAVRGVQCGDLLRQLMERDLVRISGRSAELGRPFLYSTTKRFLQVFGLRHLDELPRAQDLRTSHGGPERQPSLQQNSGARPKPGAPQTTSGSGRNEQLTSSMVTTQESAVSIVADQQRAPLETLEEDRRLLLASVEAAKDEDEEEDVDEFEDDDDDDDDEDDDEEDDEDEEFDDDFDDDDWEEVDDEDEEDDEWDDDEDEEDDADDDEEEEEEEKWEGDE
jgi:segregation and condensation protein B